MELIENYININFINKILWSYTLVYLLIGIGIYFTYKLRFIQLLQFKHTLQLMLKSRVASKGQISSFQAFCTGLGARVGSGNIAGVAIAISLGGPGAVFWMWIVAILGMATAFIESTLAQLYKEKTNNGTLIGGPAYYIKKGLNSEFGGTCFAISLIVSFGLTFNAVHSNTMVTAIHNTWAIDKLLLGAVISTITALVIFGGTARVAKFSEINFKQFRFRKR